MPSGDPTSGPSTQSNEFNYRLTRDGADGMLVSESWCHLAGGSGQRHEITSAESRLVEEGFV
jgi:hypothetical protein